MKNVIIVCLLLFPGLCLAQVKPYTAHATLKNRIKIDTLVDHNLKMRFVLDTARVTISAYSFSNKLLWKTDPWADNKLPEYRVKRPRIVFYAFDEEDHNVIGITYNNTQFGSLDKRTGKFDFEGQD